MNRLKVVSVLVILANIVCSIGCDEINSKEEESGEVEISGEIETSPDHAVRSTRVKRLPEHLDPNYPFWVKIGDCPTTLDGTKQYFCPTPASGGGWVCIDDYQLCDGVKNCPNAEDESHSYCLFFRVLKSEVDVLTRAMTTLGSTTPNEQPIMEMDDSGGDAPLVVDGTGGGDSIFGRGDDDTTVGVDPLNPEVFVSRYHRQSGRFVPIQ